MKTDLCTLKVDLDLENFVDTIELIITKFRYLHYNEILDFRNVEEIILYKKTNFSMKVILKKPLSNVEQVIIFQSILGSDWKKEACTFKNYFIHKISYWNRLFDIKRYPDGKYKEAKTYNIIDIIKNIILQPKFKSKLFFDTLKEFEGDIKC